MEGDPSFKLADRPLLLAFNGTGALFLANEAVGQGTGVRYGTELYLYSGGQWVPTSPPPPTGLTNWPQTTRAVSLAGGPASPVHFAFVDAGAAEAGFASVWRQP